MSSDLFEISLITQGLGVTLVLVGFIAWLGAAVREATRGWGWYVTGAFALPYAISIGALIWYVRGNPGDGYTWNVLTMIMCYVDILCLAALVSLTGGTKDTQSIFTPLFVVVPSISVALLWDTEMGMYVWGIIAFSIAGYLFTFREKLVVKIDMDRKHVYERAILGVVIGSIGLSVWVSANT